MKNIEEIIVEDGLKYTEEHEWAKAEQDGFVRVGITDYAQDRLSDIVFVELPKVGAHFKKGEEFGTVESVKAVSEVYMPISGKIADINENLIDAPELVNTEPYKEAWMILVQADNLKELDSLMDKKAYIDLLKG